MAAIFEEIESIAVYLIFVTVLLSLVNKSSYKKYVELVCGMVLVLVALSPLARLLSLDGQFFYHFGLGSLAMEAADQSILAGGWGKEGRRSQAEALEQAGQIQRQQVEEGYKEILSETIDAIAGKFGRRVEEAEITLDEEVYGAIVKVEVGLAGEGQEKEPLDRPGSQASPIEPVQVDKILISGKGGDKAGEEEKKISQDAEDIKAAVAERLSIKDEQVIIYEKGE